MVIRRVRQSADPPVCIWGEVWLFRGDAYAAPVGEGDWSDRYASATAGT